MRAIQKNLTSTLVVATICMQAVAQPANYDFDFVTITHPGNPGYTRQPVDARHLGRGSVGYEYRIARTEITTSQWMEFANAVSVRGQAWATLISPPNWGAQFDPDSSGGVPQFRLRPDLTNAGMVPVGGISYSQAAMFCNWLHNDKQADDASLLSGAYDIAAFGQGLPFLEDLRHKPDAKYWIPTLDEWIKAVYWDPEKSDHGGWWLYPNMSDDLLEPGPPGVGETNAGYGSTSDDWLDFRIGEYPDTMTPWGLLDASGNAREWIEEIGEFDSLMLKGAPLGNHGSPSGGISFDRIDQGGFRDQQSGGLTSGLRIVSIIPSPSSTGLFLSYLLLCTKLRRRAM